METLQEIISRMDPEDAMAQITPALKAIFPYVSEKARLEFIYAFTETGDDDTVPGLVHR